MGGNKRKSQGINCGEANGLISPHKRARKHGFGKENGRAGVSFLYRSILSQAALAIWSTTKKHHPIPSMKGLKENDQRGQIPYEKNYPHTLTFLTNTVVWIFVSCCLYDPRIVSWADCVPAVLIYFTISVLSPTMNWLLHSTSDYGIYVI